MTVSTWLPLSSGSIALAPRPKARALVARAAAAPTTLLTLLAEKEGARDLGAAAARAGLDWIWLPLENGRPPAQRRDEEIAAALAGARAALAAGRRLLVHCSAGIHRTGMIGYALLRLCGAGADEARAALERLRPVTAAGVGAERLAWGDAFTARVGS
jgi:protein-tyrosine phosphatase